MIYKINALNLNSSNETFVNSTYKLMDLKDSFA